MRGRGLNTGGSASILIAGRTPAAVPTGILDLNSARAAIVR